MDDRVILLLSILVAFFLTFFNFATIGIALFDPKIRSRTSSYPVISFLLASTFQGMFAAPIYAYKHMEHAHHITGWVCDLSRVSYYLCHHLVKTSIVVVSFDRLLSIKFPYKYAERYGTKRNMVVLLAICWIVTIIVDMMPFIHEQDDDVCHYVPNKQWRLFIIIVYNIMPFALIAMNYTVIWITATKLALTDHRQRSSIRRSFRKLSRSTEPAQDKLTQTEVAEKGKLKFVLELKATKTSLALIGVYIFCWGPLGIYVMIDSFCEKCLTDHTSKDITVALKYVCFSSNVLAPLCYCWASKDYRRAGKRIYRRIGLFNDRTLSVSRTETYTMENEDTAQDFA